MMVGETVVIGGGFFFICLVVFLFWLVFRR